MHVISMKDFTGEHTLDTVVEAADRMVDLARHNTAAAQFPNYKAVLLFMEPSTRTMLSTEQAVMNLGMRHTRISAADHTSALKGESFADTFRMYVGQGARIIALRTKIEGAPLFAAKVCQQYVDEISVINPGPVNIINCGDGRQFHPTQTVLDMLTIKRTLGRLDNFTLGIMGDLRNGRTCHSLLDAFRDRPGMKFVFVAPKGFGMPDRYKHGLRDYVESESLEALAECDIVYDTRFQMERATDEEKRFIEAVRHEYVITLAVLNNWKPTVRVMHPLPRVDEIDAPVSLDPRIIAFPQAEMGIPSRMYIVTFLCQTPYRALELHPKQPELLLGTDTKPVNIDKVPKYFQPVNKGTVIDHLPAGSIETVYRVLHTLSALPYGIPRQAVQFVKPHTHDDITKDVLLIHDYELPHIAGATLQAMYPQATINILPGDSNILKRRYAVPIGITENARCSNPACITNNDKEAKPNFIFLGQPGESHLVACEYCGAPLWD